ncbi:MAG: hypothetical protein AAFN50_11660 [Pseudomonadota bacterium]
MGIHCSRRTLRQLLAIGLLCYTLVGCEVRSLYGIEILDINDVEGWKVVETGDSRLYLQASDSPDLPGILLIALNSDSPAVPQWDWDDYQSLPADEKASTFGDFYNQKYRDLIVSHAMTCALTAENFDHRESAQEVASGSYGRRTLELPSNVTGLHPKGILVTAPIANCDQRTTGPAGAIEEFTVTLDGGREREVQRIKVRFRVYLVENYIQWLF